MSILALKRDSRAVTRYINPRLNTTIEGRRAYCSGRPVEITWINGICNASEDILRSGAEISAAMKGATIHCIGDPTQGFASDLYQATSLLLGQTQSEVVERCVATWARLVNQLDQQFPGEEGRVVHIAHSRGGLVTQRAIDRLNELSRTNPEYQRVKSRLSLHLFGSPAVITDSGVEVSHYVQDSRIGDPVPHATPFRGALHAKTEQSREYLPSEGIIQHGILGPVYHRQLMRLGESISVMRTPLSSVDVDEDASSSTEEGSQSESASGSGLRRRAMPAAKK